MSGEKVWCRVVMECKDTSDGKFECVITFEGDECDKIFSD